MTWALTAALLWLGVLRGVRGAAQIPLQPQNHTQGYQFDALLHLPGISPYFDAVGFGLEHRAPEGCKVTAASYLIRHGAIYANEAEYEDTIKPFLEKLEKHRGHFSGTLGFLNEWKSPILEDRLEDLTPSGAKDARRVGQHLLSRYPDLVPTAKRILTDEKPRTFDTATNLTQSFPEPESIDVVQIKKSWDSSRFIDPHKYCKAFTKSPGTNEMTAFVSHYAPAISARLSPFTPDSYNLSDKDVLGLQSLCGYESAINGERSQICDVFTDAEWMAYEYAWDMKYAYMVGPLNDLSPYLGFPWLQAQSELFASFNSSSKDELLGIEQNQKPLKTHGSDGDGDRDDDGWPPGQRFFLSFTHREVPPFVATALGIFNSSARNEHDAFPTSHINWSRAWKMADLIPFLGHVGMEKMSCDSRPGKEGEYVRFIANSAPRPLPLCQDGPGASCEFGKWREIIKEGSEKYKDWESVCDGTKEPGP